MPQQPINIDDFLAPKEILEIVRWVAMRLFLMYGGSVEKSETEGWAGLGVAQAVVSFVPDPANIDHMANYRRFCMWLRAKGIWNACDAMRDAKVVDRRVKGVLKQRHVKAVPLESLLLGDADLDTDFDPVDDREKDPLDAAITSELFVWATGRINRTEWDVIHYLYRCRIPVKTVGIVLNISESRVSHLHQEAIAKLRRPAA